MYWAKIICCAYTFYNYFLLNDYKIVEYLNWRQSHEPKKNSSLSFLNSFPIPIHMNVLCSFLNKLLNENGRVFLVLSMNYPRNIRQCVGISQIRHHNPSSHRDLMNPRAKHLSGGDSRFTFSSCAFSLPWKDVSGSQSLHIRGVWSVQQSLPKSSSSAPSPSLSQLPRWSSEGGEQGGSPWRAGWRWEASWGRTGDGEQNAGRFMPAHGGRLGVALTPPRGDTAKASTLIPEFHTERGASSSSMANMSESDKS